MINRSGCPIKSNRGNLPDIQAQIENDPAIVTDLINDSQTSIEELKQNIQTKSGPDLFDFIREDIRQLKKILLDPQSISVIMAAAKCFIMDQ